MVKIVYNDKLVYKVVIWVFFGISLWKEKEVLRKLRPCQASNINQIYILS